MPFAAGERETARGIQDAFLLIRSLSLRPSLSRRQVFLREPMRGGIAVCIFALPTARDTLSEIGDSPVAAYMAVGHKIREKSTVVLGQETDCICPHRPKRRGSRPRSEAPSRAKHSTGNISLCSLMACCSYLYYRPSRSGYRCRQEVGTRHSCSGL